MNTTIDDVDSPVVYSVIPSWRTDIWLEQSPPAYLNTTHRTQNPGAIATLTFTGSAVYIYGHKASDHGYRNISIDGATPTRCDGRLGSQGSRSVIYWQDGLSPGNHSLTVEHTGEALQWLNVDYFVVTSASTTASPSSPTSNTSNVIVMGVVVSIAVILLIITVIWCFCARHRRKLKQKAEKHKDAGYAVWNHPAAIRTGLNASPYIIEPFDYDTFAGSLDPNATPMTNVQHWGPHYSQEGLQSTYSSPPLAYSAPLNQSHSQSLLVPVTNPASNALAVPYNSHTTPWTSGTSTPTGSDSNQTRIETLEQTKARYSRANDSKARYLGPNSMTLGSLSSSCALSPSTINESVPPPLAMDSNLTGCTWF